mmetsp:Transcript_13735/g.27156  ORF Transcript_13735/g.27156 Transcript_13735/m.27156 type:complete len:84 (-) Transcript_13735:116-367(-)|eukprot:CAMPEP_0173390744 /NCGR_PEP_ID=MMETSP1356-20130122/16028_1 /TAXON_ID=77927 ORGANISM="Hemiselmis virescens, Strain PCC157" /NCGR_SAMPLE_ID=MMETSP1356 /ASSEMBLY_ACC=CAM_ASM_000847 /LENGTH=83 /DNA_ID=CAMNT_0014348209 /DNA_START=38 /DNA_END=289 /DNA_ORIENTATION=+
MRQMMSLGQLGAMGRAIFARVDVRAMSVGKRGKPPLRAAVKKDMSDRERRRQTVREQKARNATDLDRHVQQAYKELQMEDAEK